MKTDVSDLFAQAAYEARRQALITGAYPKQGLGKTAFCNGFKQIIFPSLFTHCTS
ncbi:hypothetical protein KSF_000400 [Reticulibacter mediterranei]|uniref:Uncharacterized protein n=1 Tax=Reticulibacter mediterranei TaxID=2778369 RepID=A0A8J3MXM8_9CHLR|nr:hypothetical protein [Reticulibacter mediterranei]GHO89992.1 hypothetical protein KSF_000400 [Reticulibacter mediterranei]